MNNTRRKSLTDIKTHLEDIKGEIDVLMEEEEEYLENMPEPFQEAERGQTAQSAIDNLENASSSIDEVTEYIDEAIV